MDNFNIVGTGIVVVVGLVSLILSWVGLVYYVMSRSK
jgi:hypothetical protein